MSTAYSEKRAIFGEADDFFLYYPFEDYVKAHNESMVEVPWPEWNDNTLNAELWGEIKEKKPKTEELKGKSKATSQTKMLHKASSFFEDPNPPELPILIEKSVFSWKRANEIFPEESLTVYSPANEHFQLSIPSSVACCKFFYCFMDLLPILQHYTLHNEFLVECETPTFISNTQGEPWRPWHHIYSHCKAGRGQVHKPLYSPFGKYILRLFYMGSWRRIEVDDKIPCDVYSKCMLPVTQVPGELWPIILVKGFLKIASISPYLDLSVFDFPFLTLLTGWATGKISTLNKSKEQIWRRFSLLVPPLDSADEESRARTKIYSETEKKKNSSKAANHKIVEPKHQENWVKPQDQGNCCFILLTLNNFLEEGLRENTIGLVKVSDVPSIECYKQDSTKTWKRIRWINWASAKGIWSDELLQKPNRHLKYISCNPKLREALAVDVKLLDFFLDIPITIDMSLSERNAILANYSTEIEQWTDFFKISDYISGITALVKPSCFLSNFKVTTLLHETPYKNRSGMNLKGTAKGPLIQPNLYFLSTAVCPNGNGPPLVFCESLTEILIVFSLWVYPSDQPSFVGCAYMDTLELLKNRFASLILEEFDWKTVQQGEIMGLCRSVGNSSIGLLLQPGRHVFKLWVESKYPVVINILSNAEIYVHRSFKIRSLMGSETERVLYYIKIVSDAFIAVTQKFGKPDLPSALRNFYDSIKPGNDAIFGYYSKLDLFIETFLHCVVTALKKLLPNTHELKTCTAALRSLFFNPNLCCYISEETPPPAVNESNKKIYKKNSTVTSIIEKKKSTSDITKHPWSLDEIKKIVLIQKVFRGFRIRLLKKCQTTERKEFKQYPDSLKKVCDIIFSPAKREVEVGRLIRNVATLEPCLLKTFKFYKDILNTLERQEYMGRIPNVEPFAWIPITRFVLGCHSFEPIPCCVNFYCNLEKYMTQAINNDTNEEVFRLTHRVSPYYFVSNSRGYTFFAFGWNEAVQKTVNWRVEIVNRKYLDAVHLCNPMLNSHCQVYNSLPSFDVIEVKNFYIPNHQEKICRCLFKIQKSTNMSIRLSTSYTEVHYFMTIYLDKKFCPVDNETSKVSDKVIVCQKSVSGHVLLPSLTLEYLEPDPWWGEYSGEPTLYILEAYIMGRSWPLTKREWGVVESFRVNGENWYDSSSSSVTTKKSDTADTSRKLFTITKRSLFESKPIENPFWQLQVITNNDGLEPTDRFTVEEDKSHLESVKALKESWEERYPGRRRKGKELRLQFLNAILTEKLKYQSVEEDHSSPESEEGESGSRESVKVLLNQISSFSYLLNDKSTERYPESPRVLPWMPTNEILTKYKKDDRVSYVLDNAKSFISWSDTSFRLERNMLNEREEDRKDFLNQCLHCRTLITNFLAEEKKLSRDLMKQAYDGRLKIIEKLKG